MSTGTIAPSSVERFDLHTESVPDSISAEPEILAPGQEPAEQGWAIDDLQVALEFTFFFLSKRLGEHWKLDDDESERFARVWKPILDKYLPMEDSEWVAPILVTAAIVGSRAMMTDWNKGKETKEAKTAKENTRTPASTDSPASSGNGSPEKVLDWEPFADSRAG